MIVQVIAQTSASSAGFWFPGPIIGFFVVRWFWRQTSITLPDGRRATRMEQVNERKRQATAAKVAYRVEKRRARQ